MEKVNNSLWNLSEDDMIQEQLEAKEKQRRDQSSCEKWALEKGREEGQQVSCSSVIIMAGKAADCLNKVLVGLDTHAQQAPSGKPVKRSDDVG